MVICVCGLIGAGKTTYALKNKGDDDILLDYDYIRSALKINNSSIAANVINCMIESVLVNNCGNTWLVRTVPRKNEMVHIDRYILINTEEKQCRDNLIRDKRLPTDIDEAQKKIKRKLNKLNVEYEIVDLFDTNEKW